jgi:hypothetical protein
MTSKALLNKFDPSIWGKLVKFEKDPNDPHKTIIVIERYKILDDDIIDCFVKTFLNKNIAMELADYKKYLDYKKQMEEE